MFHFGSTSPCHRPSPSGSTATPRSNAHALGLAWIASALTRAAWYGFLLSRRFDRSGQARADAFAAVLGGDERAEVRVRLVIALGGPGDHELARRGKRDAPHVRGSVTGEPAAGGVAHAHQ